MDDYMCRDMNKAFCVDDTDAKNTDELMSVLMARREREIGKREMTNYEWNACWRSICGVVMRDGYEAALDYVQNVRFA